MPKFVSLLSILLFAAASANAADHAVSVGGNSLSFSPSAVTIDTGDTVTFHNAGGFHNAVSDTGLFGSGAASSSGWTYTTPAFNSAGNFRYYCEIHGAPGGVGMAGMIIVQDNSPPPAPDFSISADSGSVTVAQGAVTSVGITLAPQNGFNSGVNYSVSGLPAGVTGLFGSQTATHVALVLDASGAMATGDATVTVTATSGSLVHTASFGLGVTAPASAFAIVPGITGSWYLPAQSGHGFNVEVIGPPGDANGFLAFWYVYDNAGNNLWLVGQGSYVGDTATLQVLQGTGGKFPPNFDKTKIVRSAWGTLTLKFSDCNNATAQWNPVVPGYPSGSMDLVRLSGVTGLACP